MNSKLSYAKQTGIGAANIKFEGKRTSFKITFPIRLQNNDGEDMKGLNGSILRYKINKDTLEKVKVSPKNYTEEANKCFDELEVTAPKKKVMKCFRAYHKQNTTSKSIIWKPYHEDQAKREKTEAKYLKTLIPVDQWKFAQKAGDTADRVTQNPYVKEQPQEKVEELSERRIRKKTDRFKPCSHVADSHWTKNLSSDNNLNYNEKAYYKKIFSEAGVNMRAMKQKKYNQTYEPILSIRCRGMKAKRDKNGNLMGGYEY